MKLSENARRHVGESLTIRWGTSRGRDSYGYTTCSLRNDRGKRIAACNGGGYDMRGTVIGNWIAATFPNELCALKPEDMPAQSHWESAHTRICTGKCEADATARWRAACEADENAVPEELPRLGEDVWTCPTCGGETRGSGDGKTIDDGRGFYGLRFYDPAGDWRKGILQHATKTHTQPTIDGACGESSVLNILNAIGLNLHKVHSTSKLDIYTITEYVK